MSDITVINDSEQSSLVTNGLAKNGELYLKAAGSTDAGSIVVYDSGAWKTFANEASAGAWNGNTYSVDFDGTNDYVDISGAASSLNGLSAFSLSLWYNTSDFNGGLIAGGTSVNNAFWISRYNSNQLYFNVRNGGATFLTVNVANANNTWHHVAAICDGSSSKVYVNGSVAASGTLPSLSSTGANNLAIAYIPPLSGNYCSGLIDEVAIFNSALSASDITAIYNSGVPDDLTSYSPVGWWRMGDNNSGSGTTITDQGSGGNDGTLTNGPTFSTTVPS